MLGQYKENDHRKLPSLHVLPQKRLLVPLLETKRWARWAMAWPRWAFLMFFWPWWVSPASIYPSIWCPAVISSRCLGRRVRNKTSTKRSFPTCCFPPSSDGEVMVSLARVCIWTSVSFIFAEASSVSGSSLLSEHVNVLIFIGSFPVQCCVLRKKHFVLFLNLLPDHLMGVHSEWFLPLDALCSVYDFSIFPKPPQL